MNDAALALPLTTAKPALPEPTLARWQPLRMGLVELFRYDSEEFWFRDGHLLLRGNNGTGKSKVLSLTLPFLFDAQLKPSRIEPDGDNAKKMAWNLLLGEYDRRIGYAWIEFGRLDEEGTPHYLALGAGLSAKAGRPLVESWYFVLDDPGIRINRDLWLTSPQRIVLTKERLRDALASRGQVFENAGHYRRAVDERLFRLGPRRYDALMDTLIQLRQPQLSKKPDEMALSNALTEALPPLASELLGDVAEALGQLEEDRRQLDEYQALAGAVGQFEQRYRLYAGTQSRRQARTLRQAQTEFDNASRARGDALARLQEAQAEEEQARMRHGDASVALTSARTRLDTLHADPAMQDANRLETAATEEIARRKAMRHAAEAADEADRRLKQRVGETGHSAERARHAEHRVAGARRESAVHAEAAGIATMHTESPLASVEASALVEPSPADFDRACAALEDLVRGRREQIGVLRRRHADVERAETAHAQRRQIQDERHAEVEAATQQRANADTEVDQQGEALVMGWERHYATLDQLAVDPDEGSTVLAALAEWAATLLGDNPARLVLQAAQHRANLHFAERAAAFDGQRRALEEEQRILEEERSRLESGISLVPPLPYTRGADVRSGSRPGAPFWQLVDFRDEVPAPQRALLEAALEAAGLLDAWVSPDGRLQTGDGGSLLSDTQLLERRTLPLSLANWLQANVAEGVAVSAHTIEQVLSGIACADDDVADSEAWIGPDGRFRLGALAGAWTKAEATYIGHTARATARKRRLAEIAERLERLADELAALQAAADRLAQDRRQADEEWRRAPSDEPLRTAHATAVACARDAQRARERLAEADLRCAEAAKVLEGARRRLVADASDLRLPESPAALPAVEAALDRYRDWSARLIQAIHELRLALPELRRQRLLEDEARTDAAKALARLATARDEAEQAAARYETLREAVGAKVEDLQRKLAEARLTVEAWESNVRRTDEALRTSSVARAVAGERADTADAMLQERTTMRTQTISRLQQFAMTGLLSSALPRIELPDTAIPWTIDPALTLARRVEQLLSELKDDDDSWGRVQRQINEELTELQRALSALGHQAPAETTDWGLVVNIIYQNHAERPDRLAARLAEEIAHRSELLTAKERAVLENHLQAEIAAEIQRLLMGAERQLDAINRELHKRPTSTGVRYRLLWQPLAEEEGAPPGLDAARKRLLNTSADLWSADDRNIVGTMLQRRIAMERERADSSIGRDGGSLLEQLARALDYRRWHRFRVERWQDGQWRKLSGPASSGERALGLTVPLFAAVASFYSQGSHILAPRLILLDEAFAGIDDAARAHCMGLIREFDLDFVITSEREWACYAELPGVAICQLQRQEGIDAVFLSRWTWDGRARARDADPDRRFSPA